MIRVLIIDDEELARRSLAGLLAAESDVEVLAEAANGLEALERIEELQPDAVFLDIEMPGLNGFDVLRNLARPPLVIFATAYDEFALKAFEANAVDYILKPLDPQRVKQAVDRLRVALRREPGDQTEMLRRLLRELKPSAPQKIAGHRGKRIVLLSPKEIVRAAIEDKLVFLYAGSERYLTDRTVGELEEVLSSSGFFRISRGELVNLEYVREFIPWFSGTAHIKLINGEELEVSRERARELKSAMGI